MRFQLKNHGWPIGDKLVPTGTILDLGNPASDWDRLARDHMPPPLNAVALDQEAFDVMWRAYPGQRHLLHQAIQPTETKENGNGKQ